MSSSLILNIKLFNCFGDRSYVVDIVQYEVFKPITVLVLHYWRIMQQVRRPYVPGIVLTYVAYILVVLVYFVFSDSSAKRYSK